MSRTLHNGSVVELVGRRWPGWTLPGTDGQHWSLAALDSPAVVYAYPRTGRPGEPHLTDDWPNIPGAMGCTAESCAFRDLHAEIIACGVAVFGLSSQDVDYQREMVSRLALPYPVLSDTKLELAAALGLPTFEAAGVRLLQRLTM